MNNKDISVLRKVNLNVDNYKWTALTRSEEYYHLINFPVEAERNINTFYAEVMKGLVIITGAYKARYYYEEDNYTWDKKYFASIISDLNSKPNSIAFITSEDYENNIRKQRLFPSKLDKLAFERHSNIISDLYDSVNRCVNGIPDLYNDFLEEKD